MKKKILIISLITILLITGILLIIGFTNKTYFKKYYEVTNPSGDKIKIPLPLFSYFKESSGKYNVTFSTLGNYNKTQDTINKYVEFLQACYDESYFYDKDLDITISRYQVENEFLSKEINLSYTYGNYCENEYVLDDNWMTNVMEKSTINEVVINKCVVDINGIKCSEKTININDVKEILSSVSLEGVKRIENKKNISIDETKSYYSISAYYVIDKMGYTMSVFEYGDKHMAFKVIDSNEHQKNAIYDINWDVNKTIENIYNRY